MIRHCTRERVSAFHNVETTQLLQVRFVSGSTPFGKCAGVGDCISIQSEKIAIERDYCLGLVEVVDDIEVTWGSLILHFVIRRLECTQFAEFGEVSNWLKHVPV